MDLVQIGDAYRERIFQESCRYCLSGKEDFQERVLPVNNYCKGQYGFIHPSITSFLEGRTKSWQVECDDFSGLGIKGTMKTVPLTYDLTRDGPAFPGDYNFDPKNILVCMLANHNIGRNSLSLELVLRPFYESELIRGFDVIDDTVIQVMSVANLMLDDGILEPKNIPIEYLPRKVDISTLRSSSK